MPNAFEKGVSAISKRAESVDHYFDATDHSLQAWSDTPSRHGIAGKVDRNKTLKSFGNKSLYAAQKGISVAQMATGQSGAMGLATKAAIGASAGLSATGVGLIATASTLAVAKSALAFKSARSTLYHIGGLERIKQYHAKMPCCSCEGVSKNAGDHDFIAATVLPEIIAKKKLKLARKATSVVPVVGGMLASAHSAKNSLIKRWNGNRGKQRHYHAEVLAKHLVTHECELAKNIVAELFSSEEMEQIMRMNTNKAGPLICSKMRST